MNIYYLILLFLVARIASSSASCQGLGFPTDDILEERARERGTLTDGPSTDDIIYQDGDFDVPLKGKLQGAIVRRLSWAKDVMTSRMEAAPNDGGGKQSPWYPVLNNLRVGLAKAVTTGAESDLLVLVAPLISYAERDENIGQDYGDDMQEAHAALMNSSDSFIRTLAYHIQNGSGELEEGLFRQAVRLFGNSRLMDESAWDEDDRMPIDSAGIFIMNPAMAIDELKKGPTRRVRTFLTNIREPERFFDTYVGDERGLEKLKQKYAAQKAMIDAKFVELATWAAGLPRE